jgi:hypothetical protein
MSPGGTPSLNACPQDGLTSIDPFQDRPTWIEKPQVADRPEPSAAAEPPACPICAGAGWLKDDVPFGHPNFGVLFPCRCKQAEWKRRTAAELARMSNLDTVRDKTFATFNPFVPGLREVPPRIRSYASEPANHGVRRHTVALRAEQPPDRLAERLADRIPEGTVDPRNPKQRKTERAVVIGQLPELVANGANEKSVFSDNRRRKLLVDQVRQKVGRPVTAPDRDSAVASHAFTCFDDHAAHALGIKRLERVAERVWMAV